MHVEVVATRRKGGGGAARTTDLHLAKLGNRGREDAAGVEVKTGLKRPVKDTRQDEARPGRGEARQVRGS
jgi:hypothetical protein